MALWVIGPGLVITIVGSTIRNPSVTVAMVYEFILLAGVVEGIASITYFFVKTNREGKKFLKEQEMLKGGNS